MKKRLLFGVMALAWTLTATAQQKELFDFGWQFSRDGKTTNVNLPHDWDIYAAPDPKTGATLEGGGWYPAGKGEYRKKFSLDSSGLKDKLVKLHFEGVYQKAEVYLNGQKAGQHAYGYTPFTIDVTPYLYTDKRENEVLVKVNNSEQPNCRWYSGSGIYRHVWLETMPALHIAKDVTRIWTPEVSDKQACLSLYVLIDNYGKQSRKIDDIEMSFEGGTFSLTPKSVEMKKKFMEKYSVVDAGVKAVCSLEFNIDHPHLWSPDDPYLYEAVIKLKEGGKVVDEQRMKFGIRSFSFSADKGFLLNGQPLLINGACVHHDDGVLGAMAFDAAEIRKVRLMKEAGFNLIRTSHNPTTTAFLDACDSLGMLVIDEAFDGWRTQKNPYDYSTLIDSCYREDIHAMVLRDRNHPSVICWSIGNEVIERKDIRVITTARQLKKAILEVDDTRPVTEALCAWDSDWEIYDPHAEVLDVVGYNYMMHKHASDHQRDPNRVMWQTESFPRDAFLNWDRTSSHPYIVGDIVWTGLDYLGESGIGRYYYEGERPGEHWVDGGMPEWHGAYCGDVDITGWRKPISHYRQILWENKKVPSDLYLAVREPDGYRGKIHETSWSVWPTWESWTWNGWEGKPIEVEVYTKSPEVTLYLNDKQVGKKSVDRSSQYKAVFNIPYEPGTLRAVGAEGQQASLATASTPARLRLTTDRQVITADGQDLAFITLEVTDKEGRVVPDAAIPCQVSVSGQGQFMAAASADLKDKEPTTSARVTTWKGRAIIVVRSQRKAGRINVTVQSSLPKATVSVRTK